MLSKKNFVKIVKTMDKCHLIKSLTNFRFEKNLDGGSLAALLKDSIRSVLRKKYGDADNFDIIINPKKGSIEIWRNRIIVDNIKDYNSEISLIDAKKISSDFQIGEEVSEKVNLQSLGKSVILLLKQTLFFKSREYFHKIKYKNFKHRRGEIVLGEVYHIRSNKYIIMRDVNNNEMILPKEEQIPNHFIRQGEYLRALIKDVHLGRNKTVIILSRNDPDFLKKLFENEITEIYDGLIRVKKVVRIPGKKAKVAIESSDDKLDPVDVCIGIRGTRLNSIFRELKTEHIDIINYTNDSHLYIKRTLSNAKISIINIDETNKIANVSVKPENISKAIGRNGQNIRLSSQLTGYKINLYKDLFGRH